MRWQLTRPKNVGKVAELIRKCAPKSVRQWQEFYLRNVFSQDHLAQLGKRLFVKVTEVCKAEIDDITEQDCVDFIRTLVIDRTFDGYQSEIQTVYGQLQEALHEKISPAPDEWDRRYNVDFFIKIGHKYIGLQIKPAGHPYITEIINEFKFQEKTHKEFAAKFGGAVFYVISIAEGKRKVIQNPEVIDEIRKEIRRLQVKDTK